MLCGVPVVRFSLSLTVIGEWAGCTLAVCTCVVTVAVYFFELIGLVESLGV